MLFTQWTWIIASCPGRPPLPASFPVLLRVTACIRSGEISELLYNRELYNSYTTGFFLGKRSRLTSVVAAKKTKHRFKHSKQSYQI